MKRSIKKTQAVIDGNGSVVIEENWNVMVQSIIHKSMKRITGITEKKNSPGKIVYQCKAINEEYVE